METLNQNGLCKAEYISEDDVKLIITQYGLVNGETVDNYYIRNASDKMLGFLCDYWKLQVHLSSSNRVVNFFLKAVSVSNAAKAEMVKDLNLFQKELFFYAVIKEAISVPGLKSWSAPFVTQINNNVMVFEDLNILRYQLRHKFKRFDMAHTLQALKTLARFHASSIIYEENKSKVLGRAYILNEEFDKHLGRAGYEKEDPWYLQCMSGALEAIKNHSKYNQEEITLIEKRWSDVWASAIDLADASNEYKNVICHRDLWNNNIMFHYTTEKDDEPDDCVFVDFQAARYQPPAGDVMLLLYCNLDPKYREKNMKHFLTYYIEELQSILTKYEVNPQIVSKQDFLKSAKEQRMLANVLCSCLIPQFWIDDVQTTKIFCDTVQFEDILCKNKGSFIINMMTYNSDYKNKVMEIFEELADRFCLQKI